MLQGKIVVLGITGSIAAYKIANLASLLVKQHANVHVIMTKNATEFITPLTFETLTGNKCLVDTFDRVFQFDVEHVSIGASADVMLVAPASANVIAKLAQGIADDMLTTTALALQHAPLLVSPAMNTHMFEKQVTQDNLQKLIAYGATVISPASGRLACGDVGAGKMPEPEVLLQYIYRAVLREKDMAGLHVMVTAGPTREAFDPVRYITNHSTGKMGYALAKEAAYRGAKVTLISGPVNLEAPEFVEVVPVTSAHEMYEAVTERFSSMDILLKAAAVADYRPLEVADEKIKKKDGSSEIFLTRTEDILKAVGAQKQPHQFVCGFSMETENMIENSRGKLERKNLDMIVANNLKTEGAGFGTDTNVVTIITAKEDVTLPLQSKEAVAHEILDRILKLR